jgi:hypothetical protein
MASFDPDEEGAFRTQFVERLQRIEAQLARLAQELGVPLDAPAATLPPRVAELARAGAGDTPAGGADEARDAVEGS